jgi:predicted nucleic acid-binding protein
MGSKILIDTSVFIEYQRTGSGLFLSLLERAQLEEAQLYTSAVVIMEFWAGKSMENKKVLEFANDMFQGIAIIDLDPNIAKKAGKMTRRGQISIGFDAIIAATCLEIGAKLATQNKKHFERVPDLKIFTPKET